MTVAAELVPPKERPILFSAPMVRAILEGKKTQTRRVVKLPLTGQHDIVAWRISRPLPSDHAFECWRFEETTGRDRQSLELQCPFGRSGDRLWVKETHLRGDTPGGTVWYRATEPERIHSSVRWTPSIFMPRWASRISLEVTAVRVERLNQITEDDARAEGVPPMRYMIDDVEVKGDPRYRNGFMQLWDGINGERAPWASNPWVWVVSFRRIEP